MYWEMLPLYVMVFGSWRIAKQLLFKYNGRLQLTENVSSSGNDSNLYSGVLSSKLGLSIYYLDWALSWYSSGRPYRVRTWNDVTVSCTSDYVVSRWYITAEAGFNPRLGSLLDKVELALVSPQYFGFPLSLSFHPCFITLFNLSSVDATRFCRSTALLDKTQFSPYPFYFLSNSQSAIIRLYDFVEFQLITALMNKRIGWELTSRERQLEKWFRILSLDIVVYIYSRIVKRERENQQDATIRCLLSTLSQHVSGIIMPIFRRRTCFGYHYAHLQEKNMFRHHYAHLQEKMGIMMPETC